jgi:alpha-beta hydrolase superfamily lysophospholipase
MTNSYNLSLRPKIVFFHGLNNNPECFSPFIEHFKNLGYQTDIIILPGHGDDRHEAPDLKSALKAFDQSMKKLQGTPYYAVAYSHGALYLQLWLEKNQDYKPLKQVLIAPAFYIYHQKMIEKLVRFLPGFMVIKSVAPRAFRRYQFLNVKDYAVLIQGILAFQKTSSPFKIPTLVIIDPKDEVVDASAVKAEIEKMNKSFLVQFFERKIVKKSLGRHHLLFHPEYFEHEAWKVFTGRIEAFLGIESI